MYDREMRARVFFSRIGIVVSLLFALPGRADEPWEASFRAGRELVSKSQFAEAVPRFEESLRLRPSVGALLNLADCHVRLQHLATAYETYRLAADLAGRAQGDVREGLARSEMKRIEGDIPRLRLTWLEGEKAQASFPKEVLVRLDEKALALEYSGTLVNLLPGHHLLRVERPGHQPFTRSFETAERGKLEEVAIQLIPEKPVDATSAMSPPNTAAPRDGEGESSPLRTVGWVFVVAGGAGIVAGTVFGGIAKAKSPSDAALDYAGVATATFFPGLGLAALGTAFVLFAPSARIGSAKVGLAPGGLGATVVGSF